MTWRNAARYIGQAVLAFAVLYLVLRFGGSLWNREHPFEGAIAMIEGAAIGVVVIVALRFVLRLSIFR